MTDSLADAGTGHAKVTRILAVKRRDAEFNQFLNIALGSALETEYLFVLSKDLQYIGIEIFEQIDAEINVIKSKIYKLKSVLTKK